MGENMEVEYPDHQRPLYMKATTNGVQIKRAFVDIGVSHNLIVLSALEVVGMPGKRILGASMEKTRFEGAINSTKGYMQLALRMGPIVAFTRFHVINSKVSYHILSR